MVSGIPSVGETTFLDKDGTEVKIPTVTCLNERFQVEIMRKKKVISCLTSTLTLRLVFRRLCSDS